MSRSSRLQLQPAAGDEPALLAAVAAAGPHGVYLHNALSRGDGESYLCWQGQRLLLLAWQGLHGNLLLLPGPEPAAVTASAAALASQVLQTARSWRLAMGPASLLAAMRSQLARPPLLDREQVYYEASVAPPAELVVGAGMRLAVTADRDRLIQATLLLNESDLAIDPARVDRRWLRETIDSRIANQQTHVLGPIGAPHCKLDLGSTGSGGIVLEGVFTFPDARGRGAAARLVASCIAQHAGQRVLLHVGKHNRPARSAYERAGMTATASCRLLLRY